MTEPFDGFLESSEEVIAQVQGHLDRFRMFDKYDWSAYSGCTSFIPLITEIQLSDTLAVIIVLDGDLVEFDWYSDEWIQGPMQVWKGNAETGYSEVMRQEPIEEEWK